MGVSSSDDDCSMIRFVVDLPLALVTILAMIGG